MKADRCRHTRQTATLSMERCTRAAVLDGCCVRHHPDYWPPSMWAATSEADRAELIAAGNSPEHFAARVAVARKKGPHND